MELDLLYEVFSYLSCVKEYSNREKTIVEILIFWSREICLLFDLTPQLIKDSVKFVTMTNLFCGLLFWRLGLVDTNLLAIYRGCLASHCGEPVCKIGIRSLLYVKVWLELTTKQTLKISNHASSPCNFFLELKFVL